MRYLNSKLEFLYESNHDNSYKIIRNGIIKLSETSHILDSEKTKYNLELFLKSLDIKKLTNTIGGNIINVLGTGVFGCAFSLDNKKVMKITFDYREAPFIYKYGYQSETNGIVKIDDIFKIKFGEIYAFIIIRDPLKMLSDINITNDVIDDLKLNGVTNDIITKYTKLGGIKYEIFKALKSMYDIDPTWRGTHAMNIAIQGNNIVLYDGFSKNIKLSDESIPNLDIELEKNFESMINKRSLNQLKRVKRLSKKTDIGNKIYNEGIPNVSMNNDIDVQSYEEYTKEPFTKI